MSTGQTPHSDPAGKAPAAAGASQAHQTTYTADHPDAAAVGTLPPGAGLESPRIKEEQRIQDDIPWGVRIAAAWSWRVLIILIGLGTLIWLLSHVTLLIIPLMIAALLATLLRPLHDLFVKIKIPRVLSAMLSILVLVGGVSALLYQVGQQIVTGFAEMAEQVQAGIIQVVEWADETAQQFGLEISADEFNAWMEEAQHWVQDNSGAIMGGAAAVGSTATNITVGLVLALFTLIFFLADGRKIWDFMVTFAPRKHRPAIHGAGRRGWGALGTYMRVQVLVAAVDAIGIGVGAAILGVPLALPITVLVFIGSFVPVVGAVLTGAVAVLLALVAEGFITALLMLGVVVLVQQIESNVLQPIIMGKAVQLHPLAVVLAVTAGTTLVGIVGALFAVPVLAFVKRATHYLVKEEWRGDPEAQDMERQETEEALKRAAQKEQIEAEERASLETLKRRIKETFPGLHPDRPFGRRAEAATVKVPAPKPAAEAAGDDDEAGASGSHSGERKE
ncbi:AI-2E family transporter [Nesterenkonia rhizosphaerae]|uniref:AI-2E family transporter n=1 Tax=Nesterenkonia rhizosphaerae TaxID=1348272 RepID=A0ABP9FTN8_9MICC